ncbi:UDP pyrophosphate synthase [Candidatus Paracaedimonas acanthamoebae]|nr:UDP pyrophosphate synthase [Candidatus Paracaedimonas acanthamoebae]
MYSPNTPSSLDANLPRHIAIVMDGNGRWAKARGLERLKGHYEGAEALKRTIQAAVELGIQYLTVYAFSTENWHRPEEEVKGLMVLLRHHLETGLDELIEKNIQLKFIGFYDRIEPDLKKSIDKAVNKTAHNTGLVLCIAFNYGARAEIVEAARQVSEKVKKGELILEDLNEKIFAEHFLTQGLPDPDLFIRTSGVYRLSNYLLWQMAYTEMIFLDTQWPDFKKEDLINAISEYQQRERRFGKISA